MQRRKTTVREVLQRIAHNFRTSNRSSLSETRFLTLEGPFSTNHRFRRDSFTLLRTSSPGLLGTARMMLPLLLA